MTGKLTIAAALALLSLTATGVSAQQPWYPTYGSGAPGSWYGTGHIGYRNYSSAPMSSFAPSSSSQLWGPTSRPEIYGGGF